MGRLRHTLVAFFLEWYVQLMCLNRAKNGAFSTQGGKELHSALGSLSQEASILTR